MSIGRDQNLIPEAGEFLLGRSQFYFEAYALKQHLPLHLPTYLRKTSLNSLRHHSTNGLASGYRNKGTFVGYMQPEE